MDYGAIITVAAFFVGFQLATRAQAHPLFSASVAVVFPYFVTLVLKYIYASGYNLPILPTMFSVASIITVVIQFAVSIYLFKRIRDEQGIVATIAWGIGGFIVIVLAVPLIGGLIRF